MEKEISGVTNVENMKNVKVNAYQVALVFKQGVYQYMLKEGNYWLWNKQVIVYDLMCPFNAPVELNILLKDAALAEALHVVEVKDNEIVLQYENGLLKKVLTAGRYTFWKSAIEYQFVKADVSRLEIAENIDRTVLQNRLLSPYIISYSVESYEQALLFVDGKYVKQLESGVHYWWKNSISVLVVKADKRQQQMEINGQEILTKDKAALRLNAWAQYQVVDIEKAIAENKDFSQQLYVAFQLALREYIAG